MFIKFFLQLFLAYGVTEGFKSTETADSAGVKLVDTLVGLLANLLLVVREEETSEVVTPEKVTALILGLRYREHLLVEGRLIVLWCRKLKL